MPYDVEAELVASKIAEKVVRGGPLVNAIENVVEVKIKEAYKDDKFASAVGTIVETAVGKVFDNHMGELKKELRAINARLTELEKE